MPESMSVYVTTSHDQATADPAPRVLGEPDGIQVSLLRTLVQ